ncbi:unnamed protein product [Gadus morhua 'NCC']
MRCGKHHTTPHNMMRHCTPVISLCVPYKKNEKQNNKKGTEMRDTDICQAHQTHKHFHSLTTVVMAEEEKTDQMSQCQSALSDEPSGRTWVWRGWPRLPVSE